MPDQLRVCVLGSVHAWSGARPIPLGPARQRTVFAVLVAAGGRVRTREELIAAVWGPSPPAAARDNLYTYVSGLRRSFPGRFVSRPAGYALRLDDGVPGVLDADLFVARCAEAEALRDAGAPAAAVARLGEALRLWHGEAYAGIDAGPVAVERAHLARLRLAAIERRARLQLEVGDDGLIAELTALVREHPLHEPLSEVLMAALHRAGRTAEALEVFATAYGVLRAELGVGPGPALRERYAQVESAAELLRLAALLGPVFRVDAVVAASGRPPLDVTADLDEAMAAGVLVESGAGLAFRDPLVAGQMRAGLPPRLRARAHRRIALALVRLGRPAAEVAGHLVTADEWTWSWAVENLAELTEQAPRLAAGLGRLLLDHPGPPGERERLLVAYARAEFRAGGSPETVARRALVGAADPAVRAELRQILATASLCDGDRATATTLLSGALADRRTPDLWRARHRVLLAQAGRAGDPYDRTAAIQAEWRASSVRRDHQRALDCADRALALAGGGDAGLYLDLVDNRVFSLQNLDRLGEADRSLHEAALAGARRRLTDPLPVTAAVQEFWTGRWDDAVARISAVTDDAPGLGLLGRREQRAGVLLLHGVAALIAVHRGDLRRAEAHLLVSAVTEAERESSDFLLVARARVAERRGRPDDALDIFAPLLDPKWAPMVLRHQWLPGVLRSARRVGRADIAQRAADLAAAEAASERVPARAAAALARCRALLSGDPGPALAAADHYRSVGRWPELAAALGDASVLLAARGHATDAARHEREAAAIRHRLGARGPEEDSV